MIKIVLFVIFSKISFVTINSLELSRFAVASSKIRIGASWIIALARAIFCRCPLDKFTPLSFILVARCRTLQLA